MMDTIYPFCLLAGALIGAAWAVARAYTIRIAGQSRHVHAGRDEIESEIANLRAQSALLEAESIVLEAMRRLG